MNPQDMLLQQLRDIHGAPAVPWWPPAPGWWMLAVLALIALFLLARRVLQGYRIRQRRRRLLDHIETLERVIDPAQSPGPFLSELNRVFKLVAMRAFPDDHCAELQGPDWVRFISERLDEPKPVEDLQILAEGPWQKSPEYEPAGITAVARQWVMRHG